MKLYEINNQIEAILAQESEENEDLRLDPETTRSLLDQLEMEKELKILHIARYAQGEAAEAEAVKKQADRLAKRAKTHYNRARWLREYIAEHLEPGRKVKDDTVRVGWRTNEVVEVYAEDMLPEECWRVKREPNKTFIKDAIKKLGKDVPGASLVKRLSLLIS